MRLLNKQYAPAPPGGGGAAGGGGGPTGPSPVAGLTKDFDDVRNILRVISILVKEEFTTELEGADRVIQQIGRSIEKDINKSLRESLKVNDEILLQHAGLSKKLNTEAKVQQQQLKLEQQRERIIDLMNEAEGENIKLSAEATKNLNKALQILTSQEAELTKIGTKLAAQKKVTDMYHQGLEAAFTGLSKIPILGSFIKVGDIMDKVKKKAEEGGGKLSQLGAGLKEMVSQIFNPVTMITAGIAGAISLFQTLFKIAMDFNQKMYDSATILGTSVAQAEQLYGRFQAISGVLAKDAMKSYAAISDQLGYMASTGAEFAGTMAQLANRIGIGTAEMEGLANAASMAGRSIKGTYGTIVATAKVEAMRNGFMMTNKQILNAVAKTSSGVLMNFKGNVRELVKGIVEAKKLGTTLDEMKKRGDSLLDFESSITKEFELQAMTGKNIDLQKARQFAQAKDMIGLTKELNKQGFTYTEWQKLGAIEQQQAAETFGTSVEELSKQYVLQRQITELGKAEGESMAHRYQTLMKTVEGRKKIEQSLSAEEQANLARESANEQWEKTLEKIKDTLGSILQGPVISIVNTVTEWLRNTKLVNEFGEKVKGVFNFIADLVKNIPGYIDKIPSILDKIVNIAKAWFSISIGIAAANVAAAMGATPLVGIGLGLAAAATMYAALSALVPSFSGGGSAAGAGTMSTAPSIEPMNKTAAAAGAANTPITNPTFPFRSPVVQSNVLIDGTAVGSAVTRVSQITPYALADSGGTGYKGTTSPLSPPNFGNNKTT